MYAEIITLAVDAAGADPNSATTTLVVAVLSSAGLAAIAGSIITGLFSKRKLGADAAQAITAAAANVTEMMEKQLKESTLEVSRQREIMQHMREAHQSELRKMADAHAADSAEMRRVLQLHVAWDAIAIAKMSEFGVDLPPAPPVSPAQRFTDGNGYPR